MIRHLTRGLLILGERWMSGVRRWVGAGENWLDTGVRWAFLLGVVYGGARVALGSLLGVGVVAVVVCLKALRAATKAERAKRQAPAVAAPEESPPAVGGPPADLAGYVRTVLDGAPAVHLATLAQRLTATTGRAWTGDLVRAACQEAGIPVRSKVRDLGGDRVSSGVHRDDLLPLPQPLPEAAQEGPVNGYVAGQGGNTTPLQGGNATAATPTVRRVGDLRITSTPDATNPHRTHIAVHDPTRKRS